MIRQSAPLVLIALVVGCAKADPASTMLEPGQLAVVAGARPVRLILDDEPGAAPNVAPGVTLRVGDDPGFYQLTQETIDAKRRIGAEYLDQYDRSGPGRFEAGHPKARFRTIRVTVETGALQGRSGSVARGDVRPVER